MPVDISASATTIGTVVVVVIFPKQPCCSVEDRIAARLLVLFRGFSVAIRASSNRIHGEQLTFIRDYLCVHQMK